MKGYPKKITPRYSGAASKRFWKRINALPDPARREAYSLGVVLQNVESDILRLIWIVGHDARRERR